MSSTQVYGVIESLGRLVEQRGMKADRSLDGNSLDISVVRRPGITTFERTVAVRWEGERGWFLEWGTGINARRALAIEEPLAAEKLLEAVADTLAFMDLEVRTHVEERPMIRHSR